MKTIKRSCILSLLLRVIIMIITLGSSAQNVIGQACANLYIYKSASWDDKLVISTIEGSVTSSAVFYNHQKIFVSYYIVSEGTCAYPDYSTTLYVDGIKNIISGAIGQLPPYYQTTRLPLGPLAVGTHTFRLFVDSYDNVPETNESDNLYERTITVICEPPVISGTLTLCSGSTTLLTGNGTPAPTNSWISENRGGATHGQHNGCCYRCRNWNKHEYLYQQLRLYQNSNRYDQFLPSTYLRN